MEVAEKHHIARVRPAGFWHSAWVGPVVLFLIVTGFFWKLVLTDQYTWLESGDMANQVLPWLQFQAGEWHKWRIPLWSPYEYGGHSLIGQAQPGVANPINWVLFAMPLRHGWIRQGYLHWYLVLIRFLGALFAYWLCRDLKRSRLASILAGCGYGLGGYIGTTDWPQMISGAVWAPLVFLFLLRSLRGIRPVASAILSGVFLGAAWLSGHHQAPTFISLTVAGVWIYYVFRSGRLDWKVARLAAIFGLFVFLAGALQTFPAYEYGKLAKRWVNVENPVEWKDPVPYVVHREYSLHPISLLGIIYPGIHRHSDTFLGLTITALALLALAVRWREPMVRLFGLVAMGGLFFSLGDNSVFHGILYSIIPLVEKARAPNMAILIFHFGIIVLAAYGIDSFTLHARSPWPRRIAQGLGALGAATLLLVLGIFIGHQMQFHPDDRVVLSGFIALLLAGLIYGWHVGNLRWTTAAVFALLLVLVELGNDTDFWLPHKLETDRNIYLKPMSQNSDIVTFLRHQPWPVRVHVSDKDIPFNFGDWEGIDTWGYYGASLAVNLLRLEPHTQRARILYGVNYSIAKKPDMDGQQEVFVGASGLKVYLNTLAMPRVWSVHNAFLIGNDDDARRFLQNPSFDLRERAFMLEAAPSLETCDSPDRVTLVRRLPNDVTINAEMSCRGMVILGDAYYPGWQATVDGAPAHVYEAYGAIRGVVVGKGKHKVELKFRPASVIYGGLFTALAFLTAAVVALKNNGGRR